MLQGLGVYLGQEDVDQECMVKVDEKNDLYIVAVVDPHNWQ